MDPDPDPGGLKTRGPDLDSHVHKTTYAPMIDTAQCVMLLMRADTLRGEVVGGLALEISSFVGPCEMARADRRVPLGAQKPPHHFICTHQKHYARGRINHRCINSYYPPSQGLCIGPLGFDTCFRPVAITLRERQQK
jgi:hypothetical protein